jgi:hypothetical protein
MADSETVHDVEGTAGAEKMPAQDPPDSIQQVVEEAERLAVAAGESAAAMVEQSVAAKGEIDRLAAGLIGAAARLRSLTGTGPDLEDEPINSLALSDGARLLVTQLAANGSGRDEIEKLLRDEFGVDDTAAMLDLLFRAG